MPSPELPGGGAWIAVRWIFPPQRTGGALLFLYAAAPLGMLDLAELGALLEAIPGCRKARPSVGPLLPSWRFEPPADFEPDAWHSKTLSMAWLALRRACSDPAWALGPSECSSDSQFRQILPAMAERELLLRLCPDPAAEGRSGDAEGRGRSGRL